jgi:Methyltransferase domain
MPDHATFSQRLRGLVRAPLARVRAEREWRREAQDIVERSYDDARPIDLDRLALLRSAELEKLRDAAWLERELLPRLGFNNEFLEEFPRELYPQTGEGLLHWQYPNQFSKYLVELSRHRISSYLEIGVRHGGTFAITVEYLRRFHPLRLAVGNDIYPMPGLVPYAGSDPRIHLVQRSSHGLRFVLDLLRRRRFDLVLIDGDHSAQGCRRDFEIVRRHARLIALHDIASDVVPGVPAVWREVRSRYADRYDFLEFTEQYEEVRARTGKAYLGIGLAVAKPSRKHRSGHPG